jgi:hypothetical protein
VRDTIYQRLAEDTLFPTYLPGGFYKGWEVGEVKKASTADAFDAKGRVKATALMQLENGVPVRPHRNAARQFFSIYFYQTGGDDQIELARHRAFVLIDEWNTLGLWEVQWAGDILGQEDEELRARMSVSRYVAIQAR